MILRAFGLALVLAGSVAAVEPSSAARSITFTSTHTGESVSASYYANGEYDADALEQLNRVLRDHRTNEIGVMDPRLFDYLHEVAGRAGVQPHFDVISGFRSAASNEMLRRRSPGVAEKSQHLLGKAIDVRLRGVTVSRARDIALSLKRGGVGYYPRSDFVHLDTGRVRSWTG
jgi:uncharacterized protein YcbK (DUF882 family)